MNRKRLSLIVLVLAVAIGVSPAAWGQARKGGGKAGNGRVKGIGSNARAKGAQSVERLNRLTPDERREKLSKLPPERKRQVEERLRKYNQLSPEEKDRLNRELTAFRRLPADRQEAARRTFRRFAMTPAERRPMLRAEFQSLQRMKEPERRARLQSEEFRNQYSPAEQQLLEDMTHSMALPHPPETAPKSDPEVPQ